MQDDILDKAGRSIVCFVSLPFMSVLSICCFIMSIFIYFAQATIAGVHLRMFNYFDTVEAGKWYALSRSLLVLSTRSFFYLPVPY